MDGKEIPAKELAGKSGKLNITMSVKQNDKIRSTFFDDYALQIGVLLDNKLCTSIKTENATVADAEAAGSKQLTYTALPGKGIEKITLCC
jgi:putative membrane protein